MLFLCVLKLCVPMFFLPSDHQIFVCFFFMLTDRQKPMEEKKKKRLAPILHPLPSAPPPPSCPPVYPPYDHNHQRHQPVTKQKPLTLHCHVHTFFRLLHFLHQQTFDIPLVVFSMHQKRRKENTHRKYLSHTAVGGAPLPYYSYIAFPTKDAIELWHANL